VLTRDDVIDILVSGLAKAGPGAPAPAKGRPFLSEYDIKKRLTPGGNRLTIPGQAIVSPLALDWLTLRGIEIVRE
jgi:hypothetical protein